MPALSFVVALALAPDAPEIVWDAPPECPTTSEVKQRIIDQLVGTDVQLGTLTARARVLAPETADAPWRLSIQIGDSDVRELEGQSCHALADAAAVMLAISASAPEQTAVPDAPPPAPIETTRERRLDHADRLRPAARTTAGSVEPPARRYDPARALLGIAAGVHGVGLPAVGAGLGGRVGVVWGPLRAAAYGMHWFRRQRAVIEDVAAAYRLGVGGLELCGVLGLGRVPAAFELVGCAEGEVGLLRAEGLRADPSREQLHAWFAVGGAVAATWSPRAFVAVGLRADVLAPLARYRFSIGGEPAGTIGPVDVRGAVVLEFRLPARRR